MVKSLKRNKVELSNEGLYTDNAVNSVDYKEEAHVLNCASLCSGISADKEAMKNIALNNNTKYIIEIDAQAREIYQLNHGQPEKVYEDITKVNATKLAKVDFMMISVPCQSYSLQNRNRSNYCATKDSLWESALQILDKSNSKYFIFENVEGLLSIQGGKVFQDILDSFKALNYNIKYKVLNAKDYGSPQNRKRLFIVGVRKDIKKDFSFPQPQLVKSSVNDVIKIGSDYSAQLYDASKRVPFQEKRSTDIKKLYILPHLKYAADARIVSSNGVAPTIVASSAYTKFYDEKNHLFRYLTNTELAEIQGFKNFKFSTKKMKTKQLIGNSISVQVLEAILQELIPPKYFEQTATNHKLGVAA